MNRKYDLAGLVAPLSASTFLDEFWEKRSHRVERCDRNFFSDLFSIAAVDEILSSTNLRQPAFRLVKHGSEIPTDDYTSDLPWGNSSFDGAADIDKVLSLYREGSTLVLQALHRSWKPVAAFCRLLEKQLNHSVQANAYLTPRNSQGFSPHFDTHDVFVLQISGEKCWRLYGVPLELPHARQKFDPVKHPIGDLSDEFTLRAGDFLYIPRGLVHEGLTSEHHSLHLTIGIPALTWADVFIESAANCVNDARFRRSLPIGFVEDATLQSALVEEFNALLNSFVATIDSARVVAGLAEKFIAHADPDRSGVLLWHETLELRPETRLRKRLNVVRTLAKTTDGLSLCFEGKRVEFPVVAMDALQFIDSVEESFSASEMSDDLDVDEKLIIARRLLTEGFLVVDE